MRKNPNDYSFKDIEKEEKAVLKKTMSRNNMKEVILYFLGIVVCTIMVMLFMFIIFSRFLPAFAKCIAIIGIIVNLFIIYLCASVIIEDYLSATIEKIKLKKQIKL